MKKCFIFAFAVALTLVFGACSNTTTTTGTDEFDYASLAFPNYMEVNPVRFLQTNEMGLEFDGWQDFGLTGEIQTHPWPWQTYTYQMYSYFIRNDLQDLYGDVDLPEDLSLMPEWIAQGREDGHRILWFSMIRSLPDSITVQSTMSLTSDDEANTFLRVEYEITTGETPERWIVYFMDAGGTFSSYSIRVNEDYETVLDTTTTMVKTYRLKQVETE